MNSINSTNETTNSRNKIVLSIGKLLSSKEKVGREKHCPESPLTAGPPGNFHSINTNDLEALIETKKHKMDQLKAEESVLLQRKRTYSTSSKHNVLIDNQTVAPINTSDGLAKNPNAR